MPISTRIVAAIVAAVSPLTASAARAEAFHGDYTVTFLGLSIARSSFDSSYKDGVYAIKGSVSAAGIATLFDDTKGTVNATGGLNDGGLQPQSFQAQYTSGKKASSIDIRFAGGGVNATKVAPPPPPRGPDWLPLNGADLKAAMDPIAATVVKAASPDQVCGRTVRLYDGEMRANLNLSPVEKGTISVKGYNGPTVTCRLSFQPVSGYRKGRKALVFLRTRSKINVTFAPLGQTGLYAPIHATVGTEIGTITVKARRFEATD